MILFLDFDGVIATHISYKKEKNKIDREAIKVLNTLIEKTKAEIVVSSTWRRLHTIEELQTILTDSGCIGKIISITPGCDAEDRGKEILAWIEDNNYQGNYIVIDDEVYYIKPYIDFSHIIYIQNGWFKKGLTNNHLKRYFKQG